MFSRIPQRITRHQQPVVCARPHCITATDFSNLSRNDASNQPNRIWSLPFHSFLLSPLCLLLPFIHFLFFSLLNCKYHVPFILFCSVITLLLLLFFFFFFRRPVQQQLVCLSSVTVCKYEFNSVPCSVGKSRTNVSFCYLSPSLSLSVVSPFPPQMSSWLFYLL